MEVDVIVKPGAMLELIGTELSLALPSQDFSKPQFVGPEFKNQLLPDVGEEAYHTDLSAVARGDVREFLISPAHMGARRRIPYEPSSEIDSLRFGSAVHMLLLEPQKFRERFVLRPEFGDLRTKAAKEMRDAWLKTLPPAAAVLTMDECQQVLGMARSIKQNSTALALLEGALCERTAYYRDPGTGLKCRVRPDIWNPELSALVDLKTTMSADFKDFQRSMWNYRYDLQLAMYAAGVEAATGKRPETLAIIAIEKTDPWSCVVFTLDEVARDRGTQDYRRALDGIARCVESGRWPGFPDESAPLTLPKYALFE